MTQSFQLQSGWVEVASGPCLIEVHDGTAVVHFAIAEPPQQTDAFHRLGETFGESIAYGGSDKTYARAFTDEARIVVTLGA